MTGPAALEPTLLELAETGRGGNKFPSAPDSALAGISPRARRARPAALPEVAESSVARHFVRLSQLNYSIDTGFYPLGSCTMKYNPKINEWAARLPGFAKSHPLAPDEMAQGWLEILCELEEMLCEIGGFEAATLQPAAGAHGELTAMLMIRAYHADRGQIERTQVIVPDSAHGTNPATASMVGFDTVTIPSAPDGGVDLDALKDALGPRTAAFMLTNPSTLGLFEERIVEVLGAVHSAGALAYMDGANLNAIMGKFKPGEAGFDAMHFNLHKTFSTPHGGGGPGAGPVAVGARLKKYLPGPRPVRDPRTGEFRLERPNERPKSIGRLSAFHGNAGILLRAYTYIRAHGRDLEQVSEDAVLAANYLKARVGTAFDIPFDRVCKHEFVASAKTIKKETGVRALDIAKALLDRGFHPPTMYFPLSVEEALLIEPTETESLETIDSFADALLEVAAEAYDDPESVKSAPQTTPVMRVDEAAAARKPDLRWHAPADTA